MGKRSLEHDWEDEEEDYDEDDMGDGDAMLGMHEGKGRKKNNRSTGRKRKEPSIPWTEEDMEKLLGLVEKYYDHSSGVISWAEVACDMGNRNPKQCREKYQGDLRPHISKAPWSAEEEYVLALAHSGLGNKWSDIAKFLPRRAENTIKNHWYATKRAKADSHTRSFLWLYCTKAGKGPSLTCLHLAQQRWEEMVCESGNALPPLSEFAVDDNHFTTGKGAQENAKLQQAELLAAQLGPGNVPLRSATARAAAMSAGGGAPGASAARRPRVSQDSCGGAAGQPGLPAPAAVAAAAPAARAAAAAAVMPLMPPPRTASAMDSRPPSLPLAPRRHTSTGGGAPPQPHHLPADLSQHTLFPPGLNYMGPAFLPGMGGTVKHARMSDGVGKQGRMSDAGCDASCMVAVHAVAAAGMGPTNLLNSSKPPMCLPPSSSQQAPLQQQQQRYPMPPAFQPQYQPQAAMAPYPHAAYPHPAAMSNQFGMGPQGNARLNGWHGMPTSAPMDMSGPNLAMPLLAEDGYKALSDMFFGSGAETVWSSCGCSPMLAPDGTTPGWCTAIHPDLFDLPLLPHPVAPHSSTAAAFPTLHHCPPSPGDYVRMEDLVNGLGCEEEYLTTTTTTSSGHQSDSPMPNTNVFEPLRAVPVAGGGACGGAAAAPVRARSAGSTPRDGSGMLAAAAGVGRRVTTGDAACLAAGGVNATAAAMSPPRPLSRFAPLAPQLPAGLWGPSLDLSCGLAGGQQQEQLAAAAAQLQQQLGFAAAMAHGGCGPDADGALDGGGCGRLDGADAACDFTHLFLSPSPLPQGACAKRRMMAAAEEEEEVIRFHNA